MYSRCTYGFFVRASLFSHRDVQSARLYGKIREAFFAIGPAGRYAKNTIYILYICCIKNIIYIFRACWTVLAMPFSWGYALHAAPQSEFCRPSGANGFLQCLCPGVTCYALHPSLNSVAPPGLMDFCNAFFLGLRATCSTPDWILSSFRGLGGWRLWIMRYSF